MRRIEVNSFTPEITPLGIYPLSMDFRDSKTKNILNGQQAYTWGKDLLIMAMREFEHENPLYSQNIFDEKGRFEDKDFVMAGYEDYLALSHLHELEPYVEKFDAVADRIVENRERLAAENPELYLQIPLKDDAKLPFLAQVYMAKESNIPSRDLEFMVDYESKHPSLSSERMDLMRRAFLEGQTVEDVQKWVDKPFDIADALHDSKPFVTPEQYEVLLSSKDYETVRALSIAFEFDKTPVEVGQAIVDFNNRLEENQDIKQSLPYWFKHDGKVDIFTALSNSRNITADEVRRLGNIVLNTGKSLDFDKASEILNAFREIGGKESRTFGKAWTPAKDHGLAKTKDVIER